MRVARVVPANDRYWINIAVAKGKALNLEKVVEPLRGSANESADEADIGIKEATISKNTSQKTAEYYKDEDERMGVVATHEYVRELQLIARQCNCTIREKQQRK